MLTNKGSAVLCSKRRARRQQVCAVLPALLHLAGGLGTLPAELLIPTQGRETSGCRGERAGGRAKHREECTCRGWEVTDRSQQPPASAHEQPHPWRCWRLWMGAGQPELVGAASPRQGLEGLFQPQPFCDLQCYFPSSYFCVLHAGMEERRGWQTQHTSGVVTPVPASPSRVSHHSTVPLLRKLLQNPMCCTPCGPLLALHFPGFFAPPGLSETAWCSIGAALLWPAAGTAAVASPRRPGYAAAFIAAFIPAPLGPQRRAARRCSSALPSHMHRKLVTEANGPACGHQRADNSSLSKGPFMSQPPTRPVRLKSPFVCPCVRACRSSAAAAGPTLRP